MDQREDTRSIDARAVGPTATLAALVERYQQRLGAYLFHLVGDLDLALAITRETFLRCRAASAGDPTGGGVRIALYRVATGLALSRVGDAQATGRVGDAQASGRVGDAQATGRVGDAHTAGRVGDARTAGRVARRLPRGEAPRSGTAVELSFVAERGLAEVALRELAPGERAVLLLCDLEQFPIGDVAAILGVSGEMVCRRLARARGRFRLAYVEACGARH